MGKYRVKNALIALFAFAAFSLSACTADTPEEMLTRDEISAGTAPFTYVFPTETSPAISTIPIDTLPAVTTAPTETTTVPSETTTVPSETTTVPSETTTVPSETTTAPAETTTKEETQTEEILPPDAPEIARNFRFEATDEEDVYTLTNISGEFIKIEDMGVFAYFAETTGGEIRRVDIHHSDRDGPLCIHYLQGEPDLENVDNWFRNRILEEAISLDPFESCKVEIIRPIYPTISPTVLSTEDIKLSDVHYTFSDMGFHLQDRLLFHPDDRFIEKLYHNGRGEKNPVFSLDKNAVAYINAEDQLFYGTAKQKQPLLIGKAEFVKISLSGNTIVYSEVKNRTSPLYLFRDGKEYLVTKTCTMPNQTTISSNGQSVIYREDINREIRYFYYTNGYSTALPKGIEPIAIADSGNIVYYKKDKIMYAQKGGDADTAVVLCDYSETGYYPKCRFNDDLTEVLFSFKDRIYISKNGGEPIFLIDDNPDNPLMQIFPENTARADDIYNYMTPPGQFYYDVEIFGIDTFAGTFFYSVDLYYLDADYIMQKVVQDVTHFDSLYYIQPNFNISRDGNVITFRKYDNIYRFDMGSPETFGVFDTAGKEIDFYKPAEDGNSIYYMTDDSEICYTKAAGKTTVIKEGTGERDYAIEFVVVKNGIYLLHEKTLWFYQGTAYKKWSTDGYYYQGISGNGRMIYLDGYYFGFWQPRDVLISRDGTVVYEYEE